jgi:phage tail-like protein
VAQTGQRVDPFRAFNFLVELEGIAQASFSDCTGLASSTEVIENREGGDSTTVHKLPGKTTYADITLKWGLTDSQLLWRWRQQVVDGDIAGARRNGSLVVFDLANSTEVARWNFLRAWPREYTLAGYSARGNDIAIDTLVLTHEKLVRA